MGPRPLGQKETDELLMPSGKAYTLLTHHLNTDQVSALRKLAHAIYREFFQHNN